MDRDLSRWEEPFPGPRPSGVSVTNTSSTPSLPRKRSTTPLRRVPLCRLLHGPPSPVVSFYLSLRFRLLASVTFRVFRKMFPDRLLQTTQCPSGQSVMHKNRQLVPWDQVIIHFRLPKFEIYGPESKRQMCRDPQKRIFTLSTVRVSDYVQCEYCGRNFSSNAAERHIPFCR